MITKTSMVQLSIKIFKIQNKLDENSKVSQNFREISQKQPFRTSHRRCSIKKVFLKILQISQENTFVGVSFNKVVGLKACNFIKKRLQHKCFPVNNVKFFRTAYFIEHLGWLLLTFVNDVDPHAPRKIKVSIW